MSIKLISDEHLNTDQVILKLVMLYLNAVILRVGHLTYQSNHCPLLAVSVLHFPFELSYSILFFFFDLAVLSLWEMERI